VGDHLWNLGHRKVAFVAPSAKSSARVTRQRWQGLQSVWVEQSAPIEWCTPTPYDGSPNLPLKEQVEKAIDTLVVGSKLSVTALICTSESVALYTLQTLKQRGIDVPGDVSVTSFGDTSHVSDAVIPALTTVKPPVTQIATTAIAQLYALHGETEQKQTFMTGDHHRDIGYPGELLVRESTGKAVEINL
jgi:LacI family transcriptional regulator